MPDVLPRDPVGAVEWQGLPPGADVAVAIGLVAEVLLAVGTGITRSRDSGITTRCSSRSQSSRAYREWYPAFASVRSAVAPVIARVCSTIGSNCPWSSGASTTEAAVISIPRPSLSVSAPQTIAWAL